MKTTKKTLCLFIALLLICQVVVFAACGDNNDKNALNNETTPLVFSTEPLDGVFNPFSYTSGADGGIVGETQIGMLTIDKNGKTVAGWDQPTVAEAYSVVTTGTEADFDRDGDYSNFYTDYYFAIKDGIKFSDGVDLTIKDVLFNLYVNLDPVYTGSSTMYSIDIQGLSTYRTQNAADDAEDNLTQAANTNATMRWQNLISWCQTATTGNPTLEEYFTNPEDLAEVKSDIAKIKELFKAELNTDWTSAGSVLEEYEKYYLRSDATDAIITGADWSAYTAEGNTNVHVTQQWEIFLIMYGQITTQVQKFDDDGTKKYTFEYNGMDKVDHEKDALINRVYTDFFPANENSETFKNKLLQVITQYATSNTYFEYAVASEKSKLLNVGGDALAFPTISGITTYIANSIPQAAGQPINFDGNRNVLKIRINGVDPKAILNFSFSVAPMHYYSTQEAMAKFVELPDTVDEEGHTVKNYTGFGVEYASPEFMNQLSTKLVPVGAGAYRASNGTPEGVSDTTVVAVSEFYRNNIVNFERNNFFSTVMKNGHNANIKFLRYKVIASNSMVNAVIGASPEVHLSMPTATSKTNEEIRKASGVKQFLVDNMGYGYIGINAGKVKDLYVRRAIMHAMNVDLCRNYYGSDDLVEIIYRSMSTNNWAYPKGATAYYEYDETGATSLLLVQQAGYSVNSKTGILQNAEGETLKFTFTVAGESEDHPAYQTMVKAAEILNKIGFDITVTKDSLALSKLASGQLEIWAAAWGSSIDPDMYQVYHKESTASSIKNWGYPYLLREGTYEELDILDQLAEQIELGRKYLLEADRIPYYHAALDLVMELAVELPTYQRKNMYLINTNIIDESTLLEPTVHQSPVAEIWNLSFVTSK